VYKRGFAPFLRKGYSPFMDYQNSLYQGFSLSQREIERDFKSPLVPLLTKGETRYGISRGCAEGGLGGKR